MTSLFKLTFTIWYKIPFFKNWVAYEKYCLYAYQILNTKRLNILLNIVEICLSLDSMFKRIVFINAVLLMYYVNIWICTITQLEQNNQVVKVFKF